MIIGLFSFLYLLLLIVLTVKWNQYPAPKNPIIIHKVSVVIPFRNEENNLANTLTCLMAQKSEISFEIILINDHSTDNSLSIAQEFADKNPQIIVFNLSDKYGKKAALELGISQANSEWILQSDADCEMSENWLQSMCSSISSKSDLVLGPVMVKDNHKKWDWFNQLECLVLQNITAVSALFNQPLLSNGANLLFKKQDYLDYLSNGLGQDFASGDDYFLMQFIHQKYGGGIKYVKNKNAIVTTSFPSEWHNMISQRSRWAKKSIGTKGIASFFMIFFVGIHFVFPFLLIASVFNLNILHNAIPFIALKTGMELILIYYTDVFFRTRKYNKILLFAIFYPVFLFQIILSMRNNKNSWKDREI